MIDGSGVKALIVLVDCWYLSSLPKRLLTHCVLGSFFWGKDVKFNVTIFDIPVFNVAAFDVTHYSRFFDKIKNILANS